MTPTSTLRDRVMLGIAAQPSRTRAQGRVRKVVLFAMAVLASTGPPLLGSALDVEGLSVASGSLLVAVACAATATWRGKSLLGHSAFTLVSVSVLAPLARWVWLLAWPSDAADADDAMCFARTVASSAPLLATMFFVRARTVVDHPRAHGAALGTTAGAFGAVVVDVFCARAPPSHVFMGHVLPIFVLAAIGALAGRVLVVRSS
jgi:hypothetical protein